MRASGYVWVSEQGNNRVPEFSETGTFLLKFGTAGSQAGQFNAPGGLAVDAKGNLWVADTNNNRIEKWTASSGVASVSIKVDGTVVSSTAPGCPLEGCSIVREWTLNSSSYSVGPHTVEASAIDAAGHAANKL